jgi:hypothetical protein
VLTAINRGATPVTYQLMTIKGIQYALFPAVAGSHTATYGAPGGAPQMQALTTTVESDGTATVSFSTDQPSTSRIVFGTTPRQLGDMVEQAGTAGDHELTITDLEPAQTYFYRVVTAGADGVEVWPPLAEAAARLVTPAADRAAPTISDLSLAPRADGTVLVTWSTSEPTDSTVRYGRRPDGPTFEAYGDPGVTEHSVVITGLDPGATYDVEVVSLDPSGNRSTALGASDRVVVPAAGVAEYMAASQRVGELSGGATIVEDVTGLGRITLASNGSRTGSFVSRVLDARRMVTWDAVSWEANVPAGSSLTISVRGGDSEAPGASWSDWQTVDRSGGHVDMSSRFVQYRVELKAGPAAALPELYSVSITHSSGLPPTHGEQAHAADDHADDDVLHGAMGRGGPVTMR